MHIYLRLLMPACLAGMLLTQCACHADTLPEPGKNSPEEPDTELADAYHDKTRQQPYPKAGNELYLNPSPLIVPQKMKTGDLLQFSLSRKENFTSSETLISEPKAWCMFNPHHRLETGQWYWRFRSVKADGSTTDWSMTYQFEVKEETPSFVTPAFETFYKNAPRQHPRLYCFLNDRIEQAQCNAPSHPEYKALLSRAASALNVDWQHFGNPYDRIGELKSYVQYLYQAQVLAPKSDYYNRLRHILRLMLDTPIDDRQLFASNFGTTDIAICLTKAYDLLYSGLSLAERENTERLLMRILRVCFNRQCGAEENHIFDNHFWQHNMRILFQTAFILYDKTEYAQEVIPILEYYYELWTARAPASGFNRDGVWHNGSGYFNANIKTLYYMPLLLSYVARRDFLQHPWYQHAGQALVYTWPPGSKSNGFGDGSESGNEPMRQRVAFADFLARETGDAYAGWYADQCLATLRTDIDMRLYRMASPRTYTTTLPERKEKFVWYKDAGEVAMHSDLAHTENNLTLSFRSSTFGSGSHTTACQNAFNLIYRGEDVYRSSGYYTNFSDAHNLMSYRHTRAHNTILVNGIGQPYSTHGYGNVTRAMGGQHITYCLGDASHAYCGISNDPLWTEAFEAAGITQTPENGFGPTPLSLYRRHLLMLHPNIVLVYDELEAKEAVRWEWLLHSPKEFAISPDGTTFSTWNEQKGFVAVTQLFSNEAYKALQTDKFVVPPATGNYPNQWHLTARIEGAPQLRLLAVIQVNPEGKQAHAVHRNENRLTVGKWTIEAELDASQPATLLVRHAELPVLFCYGNDCSLPDGESFERRHDGSSLLYDVAPNGEYQIMEQSDYKPVSTRTSQ